MRGYLRKPNELLRELHELGVSAAFHRSCWELRTRSGLEAFWWRIAKSNGGTVSQHPVQGEHKVSSFLAPPGQVAGAVRSRIDGANLEHLGSLAHHSTEGRILCFGRWIGDYGNPIDWQRNPCSGATWNANAHWTEVLRDESSVGDVKLTWEVGRFPHAFLMARAAAFRPHTASSLGDAFARQVRHFVASNPVGYGVHWVSGQEVAIRLLAWLFAAGVFQDLGIPLGDMTRVLHDGTSYLFQYREFARQCVPNNHVISEALALYIFGGLFGSSSEGMKWHRDGKQVLEREADKQVYGDGGYIQQSHNYHRMAMQLYLWAVSFAQANGKSVPEPWLRAMGKSLDFLVAQQNHEDGRLPNYGSNDGALPFALSTCDYSDFRPALQALSIAVRRERIYPPGPWDEEAAWLFGPAVLDLPLRQVSRTSVSFPQTGFHVLRGRDAGSFAVFRCGSLRARFSQMDMLHLDVWWRGYNVLADGGSYLYNGPERWHNYFLRTGSHNTVQIDGQEQMKHTRRFKLVGWTKSRLLRFEDAAEYSVVEGEHFGFRRGTNGTVHRRSVLFLKDDLWVVADHLLGTSVHAARLHWLCGPFAPAPTAEGVCLKTPAGPFSISMFDMAGRPLNCEVATGLDTPSGPRGWHSRYYGSKEPVPSLCAECQVKLPTSFVSVLAAGTPVIAVERNRWNISGTSGSISFDLVPSTIQNIEVFVG